MPLVAEPMIPFETARVRADFPALQQQVNGHPVAYLDNAATSQKPQQVLDRLQAYYREENSNVHRGVHTMSQRATESYEGARQTIADYIGSPSEQVVFTRGTTDAINLVAASFGSTLKAGDEIVLTAMEHHSNIVPWQLLAGRTGVKIRVAPVDSRGVLDYPAFEMLLGPRTRLVAVAHVSNTLGTINPVARMIRDAHGLGIPVLVDGAQAMPHQRVDVGELDCDFYCFSGHKMFGPTGIGVLYGKAELLNRMPPYQGGGDMIASVSFGGTTFNDLPHKFEAGTPHIAGAIGLGAAVEYLQALDFIAAAAHEKSLVAYATKRLAEIDDMRFIGTAPDKAGVVSFLIGTLHPYDVGTVVDRFGVAVRTGHHCTQPLMEHYGIPGTVRASFAFYNTMEEVDRLVDAVAKAQRLLS